MSKLQPLVNIVRQKPVLAVFEINLQCNSSCGYCDLPLNKGRYEMSRTEIQQVFLGLYNFGIRYVLLQGGEPTLRKDLLEIIHDLHAIGFQLALITNGTRLSDAFIEKLQQYPVSLSVSLDTLDRETYKRIRGADQLGMVSTGLQRLATYPHPKYITCIVSKENLAQVMDVVRYARNNRFIPVVGAYHWDIERYGKVDSRLQYSNAEAIQLFQEIADSGLVPRGYFHRYLQDNIRWLSGRGLDSCDAGRYSIAIDPSANVAPCLALSHSGNLLQNSLQNILADFNRSEISACSARSSCNMMCSRVVGSSLRHPVSSLLTPNSI